MTIAFMAFFALVWLGSIHATDYGSNDIQNISSVIYARSPIVVVPRHVCGG